MSSTTRSGVITLLHTACGAGILAMPYAFKPFGLVLGLVMIVFCGMCSAAGLLLQGHASKYAGDRNASFFSLSQITYPQLGVIFDLAIVIKCFGVGVSYMVVVGDLLPQICATFTTHEIPTGKKLPYHGGDAFNRVPTLFYEETGFTEVRIDDCHIRSRVPLRTRGGTLSVALSGDTRFARRNEYLEASQFHSSALSSFPIYVFAYTCHHNMFSIVNELKDNSLRNIYKIALIAIALAMTLYLLIGGTGYATFGDNVPGNIITLYPQSASTTIGRVAIVFLVMLAFPLQCHPARASVNHIFHYFTNKTEVSEGQSTSSNASNKSAPRGSSEASRLITTPADELIEEGSPQQPAVVPMERRMFIVITSSILLCSYLLAISVTSLARVLAIVGATGSTSISFILPGVFGYQLIGSEYKDEPIPFKTKLLKYAALLLTCWGFLVLVTCLSASILFGASH